MISGAFTQIVWNNTKLIGVGMWIKDKNVLF